MQWRTCGEQMDEGHISQFGGCSFNYLFKYLFKGEKNMGKKQNMNMS